MSSMFSYVEVHISRGKFQLPADGGVRGISVEVNAAAHGGGRKDMVERTGIVAGTAAPVFDRRLIFFVEQRASEATESDDAVVVQAVLHMEDKSTHVLGAAVVPVEQEGSAGGRRRRERESRVEIVNQYGDCKGVLKMSARRMTQLDSGVGPASPATGSGSPSRHVRNRRSPGNSRTPPRKHPMDFSAQMEAIDARARALQEAGYESFGMVAGPPPGTGQQQQQRGRTDVPQWMPASMPGATSASASHDSAHAAAVAAAARDIAERTREQRAQQTAAEELQRHQAEMQAEAQAEAELQDRADRMPHAFSQQTQTEDVPNSASSYTRAVGSRQRQMLMQDAATGPGPIPDPISVLDRSSRTQSQKHREYEFLRGRIQHWGEDRSASWNRRQDNVLKLQQLQETAHTKARNRSETEERLLRGGRRARGGVRRSASPPRSGSRSHSRSRARSHSPPKRRAQSNHSTVYRPFRRTHKDVGYVHVEWPDPQEAALDRERFLEEEAHRRKLELEREAHAKAHALRLEEIRHQEDALTRRNQALAASVSDKHHVLIEKQLMAEIRRRDLQLEQLQETLDHQVERHERSASMSPPAPTRHSQPHHTAHHIVQPRQTATRKSRRAPRSVSATPYLDEVRRVRAIKKEKEKQLEELREQQQKQQLGVRANGYGENDNEDGEDPEEDDTDEATGEGRLRAGRRKRWTAKYDLHGRRIHRKRRSATETAPSGTVVGGSDLAVAPQSPPSKQLGNTGSPVDDVRNHFADAYSEALSLMGHATMGNVTEWHPDNIDDLVRRLEDTRLRLAREREAERRARVRRIVETDDPLSGYAAAWPAEDDVSAPSNAAAVEAGVDSQPADRTSRPPRPRRKTKRKTKGAQKSRPGRPGTRTKSRAPMRSASQQQQQQQQQGASATGGVVHQHAWRPPSRSPERDKSATREYTPSGVRIPGHRRVLTEEERRLLARIHDQEEEFLHRTSALTALPPPPGPAEQQQQPRFVSRGVGSSSDLADAPPAPPPTGSHSFVQMHSIGSGADASVLAAAAQKDAMASSLPRTLEFQRKLHELQQGVQRMKMLFAEFDTSTLSESPPRRYYPQYRYEGEGDREPDREEDRFETPSSTVAQAPTSEMATRRRGRSASPYNPTSAGEQRSRMNSSASRSRSSSARRRPTGSSYGSPPPAHVMRHTVSSAERFRRPPDLSSPTGTGGERTKTRRDTTAPSTTKGASDGRGRELDESSGLYLSTHSTGLDPGVNLSHSSSSSSSSSNGNDRSHDRAGGPARHIRWTNGAGAAAGARPDILIDSSTVGASGDALGVLNLSDSRRTGDGEMDSGHTSATSPARHDRAPQRSAKYAEAAVSELVGGGQMDGVSSDDTDNSDDDEEDGLDLDDRDHAKDVSSSTLGSQAPIAAGTSSAVLWSSVVGSTTTYAPGDEQPSAASAVPTGTDTTTISASGGEQPDRTTGAVADDFVADWRIEVSQTRRMILLQNVGMFARVRPSTTDTTGPHKIVSMPDSGFCFQKLARDTLEYTTLADAVKQQQQQRLHVRDQLGIGASVAGSGQAVTISQVTKLYPEPFPHTSLSNPEHAPQDVIVALPVGRTQLQLFQKVGLQTGLQLSSVGGSIHPTHDYKASTEDTAHPQNALFTFKSLWTLLDQPPARLQGTTALVCVLQLPSPTVASVILGDAEALLRESTRVSEVLDSLILPADASSTLNSSTSVDRNKAPFVCFLDERIAMPRATRSASAPHDNLSVEAGLVRPAREQPIAGNGHMVTYITCRGSALKQLMPAYLIEFA